MKWALIALFIVSVALILAVAWISAGSNYKRRVAATQVRPSLPGNPLSTLVANSTGDANSTQTSTTKIGRRTKTGNCLALGALPDPACTPGEVLTTDAQAVCTPGYASKVRNVTSAKKNGVFSEYGVSSHSSGQYEIDHLIGLELGGSNGVANLWPELADPPPGFHQKDQVENYLHAQVCSGAMSLPEAQYDIATNWLSIYQSMGP